MKKSKNETALNPWVRSSAIVESALYTPRNPHLRLDRGPFYVIHALTWTIWTMYNGDVLSTALLLIGFAAHVLVFLSCHWSVRFGAFVTHRRTTSIQKATHILAIPPIHHGNSELCALQRKANDSNSSRSKVEFTFQNRKYRFDYDQGVFVRLRFELSESIDFYRNWRGYKLATDAESSLETFGPNQLNIPIPTFGELFKEQAVAPFFVFQVFCVLLWCLDEYWYYSLFTLFLLVTFESTIVGSRLRNLRELRGMTLPVVQIPVYRERKWTSIPTDKLVPGDLISLNRMTGADTICPCDALLLEGTCITDEAMLTGESVPQLKEPVWNLAEEKISLKKDKIHIIYSGTKILQTANEKEPGQDHFKTPNGGSLAYVIRTGFDTSQGKLMRMILFATERVTANNWETFLFIMFLLVFALAAAGYVLYNGLQDESRSRYYLALNCIMIITSVIPPELPMELSLAVNNSLLALSRLGVFCTEPFRIPYGGKVDICCFDKTGTLTSDQLSLKGLAVLGASASECKLIATDELPPSAERIIGGCHSLIQLDQKIVGDPMEMAALKAINWTFLRRDVCSSTKESKQTVRIIHRNHFSSNLKRMSTLCHVEGASDDGYYCLVKGAPETVATLLEEVPPFYAEASKHYSHQGARVLAIASKKLTCSSSAEIKSMSREASESNLRFVGFLIFSCPIKPDTPEVIKILQKSSHEITMITGDHVLTACYVAQELSITRKPVANLRTLQEGEGFAWYTLKDSLIGQFNSITESQQLLRDHELCVSGEVMSKCPADALFPFLPYVRVFARVSPDQKEWVLKGLKDQGFYTLMCGDGTNDVGALKQAHVGIALLNRPFKPAQKKPTMTFQERLAEARAQAEKMKAQKAAAAAAAAAGSTGPNASAALSVADRRALAAKQKAAAIDNMKKTMDMLGDMEDPSVVRLGDASIASPFIAKTSSIMSCVHIIRQGRCTLVTTLEMYKILALNCLVTAYSLSVLNLDGVKLGDTQATFAGMMVAMCFMFLSRAQPAEKLSAERPPPNIFNAYVLSSIVTQFMLHLYTLVTAVFMARSYADDAASKPEDDFKPNIVNTCVFLVSMTMQVSTFAINYRGRPFMQSLRENPPMFYILAGTGALTFAAASNMVPDASELLQLVPYPNEEFRQDILKLLALDFFGSYACEKTALFLFGRQKPKSLPYAKANTK
eukprot:TRINITY_DN6487_c0_g1_i1.p1 TRINITY_DN6487_c0_g1~~TRINITY_DN6487_c0_g1_i1.p1  ORF type:complete len:1188 (+),score=202.34 TRINITY_DN6487_c0_g1_i1:53-3616(+)